MLQLILVVVFFLLAFVYWKGRYNEYYWNKRGVAYYPRNKLTGVTWDFFVKDKAYFEHIQEIYYKYSKEPAVGLGSLFSPSLLVTDSSNIQHVMVTDFNSFHHRGFELNKEDLLAQNVLLLNGNKWKLLRQNMSPLFTSLKLRSMYYIIDKSARDFIPYIKENPDLMKGKAFNTLSTFCCAAVSAAVFGISSSSVFDSPFLKMAQNVFKPTFWWNAKFMISMLIPSIMKLFRIKIFAEYEEFFIGAIKRVIEQRKIENVKRHDFIDLCVSLQKTGTLKDTETGLEIQPTNELLAAQAFFYFTAGVDPTAATLFHTLYLLGKHPEALRLLQDEIDLAFEINKSNITYDTISNMEYLDMVINESMRMYPVLGYLVRKCVKDTTLPIGNINIEKGTLVFLPLFPLHNDPKYHSDPKDFNPERFSKKSMTPITERTYMPFGKGNRVCIGQRYATLQIKAGLIHLLHNFTIKVIRCQDDIRFSKEPIQVKLKNVDIEFIKRKTKIIY